MIGLEECGPAPPRAPSTIRSRERTAQAVDYYNTHVQRARVSAGLSSTPNRTYIHQLSRRQPITSDLLYRSNSSLELVDHQNKSCCVPTSPLLRREYGSHGSIDVIDRPTPISGDTFFAMLQDYRPAMLGAINTDQRSPGPSEYLRGKVETDHGGDDAPPQSPKLRGVKLAKFWGGGGSGGTSSAIKHQRHAMDDSVVSTSSTSSVSLSADAEEIQRRRAFVHYDCQSLTTNLSYSVRIRKNLLSKRRNTTTGASAASMNGRSSTPDGDSCDDEDYGDGHANDLVESCKYFRNEIGGEEERMVSLTRLQNSSTHSLNTTSTTNSLPRRPLHRPPLAYGVAVLEFPLGETHWRHSTCPYQRLPRPIESVDQGALYYRNYFMHKEHQNWFGMDEQLGPVAISIRREKVPHRDNQTSLMQYQYRLIIRTSELLTLRGATLEDAIPNIKTSGNKSMNVKEVLEYVAPEIQISCLRLGVQNPQTEEQLRKLDEQGLNNHYKVGVMYCKAGQQSEEEMYNNEHAGPAFQEFLETIGKKFLLKGFDKYRAGLDNKSDSTGIYSVYSQYQECEIMFHVSTMLPFTPNNRQQLLRKRHIGNDIVTIVFQEPGALPFTPKNIRSQFQHVFIIVRAINPCTENTHYSVAVSRSKDVQVFGPPIKEGAIFPKSKTFAEFLLAKVVNAENAAHRSEKFVTMATRTRQEYLKDLVANFSTTTPVDTGQKFSIFSSKKKEKIRPRFIPDACQRGAILWQVLLDDSGQSQQVECYLGISADTMVLIEEQSKQIVFVTPCKSVLGWWPQTNSLRIYHHQGECMTIHIRDSHSDRDELMEIVDRLKSVTQGAQVQELSLQRNIMGQLGFHVQPDGIVTLVESAGHAWQAGLRQNSRLVEICKVAVSTLTYDQMVDLLKTSALVTLTVIPPFTDGSPRKGCALQNCKYNEGNCESDYENNSSPNEGKNRTAQLQQAVPGNHKWFYGRSFSPPRSSGSSGYGTGGSSKSFLLGQDNRYTQNSEKENFHSTTGTLTSSSSGHSDDRWYDYLQENGDLEMGVPPPLPVKSGHHSLRSNSTYPSTPKRGQVSHIQVSQSHNHFGSQNNGSHSKVQVSHSLPLQHANYSSPLTASLHNNTYNYEINYDLENLLKDDKARQETEYVVTKAPKVAEYTTVQQLSNELARKALNDGHSTDSSVSDRLYGLGSEDETSNGSGGASSPHLRRSTKHLASLSNNNSRNHSPRSLNGEAKLRPGVTSRSSNRNSANLSSAFQEELIRLIDPDNIESTEPIKLNKSQSRDNLNNALSVHKSQSQPEVILTMARPATVISNASTTSSPLPGEFKGGTKDDLSLRTCSVSKSGGDMSWPSIVCNKGTRVIIGDGSQSVTASEGEGTISWEDESVVDASITSAISTSTSVPELQEHMSELESRVSRETQRRLSLENEVRRLKEENRKLHNQAQTATSQLKTFKEWYFKNVHRQ